MAGKKGWEAVAAAAAASYEAARRYEQHIDRNGQPDTHAKAMEILTGFAGATVDHLIETKRLGSLDRDEVRREAERQLAKASSLDYN